MRLWLVCVCVHVTIQATAEIEQEVLDRASMAGSVSIAADVLGWGGHIWEHMGTGGTYGNMGTGRTYGNRENI